jgi:hypothetical protein
LALPAAGGDHFPQRSLTEIEGCPRAAALKRDFLELAGRVDQNRGLCGFAGCAGILGLQIGEPVMLVHGVTYLDDGRAIEAQESHFRAESIEFIIVQA